MVIFIGITVMFIYSIYHKYRSSNRELKRLNSVNEGKLLTLIGELSNGLVIIRSHMKQNYFKERYLKYMEMATNS
jgi:hypothetical protein